MKKSITNTHIISNIYQHLTHTYTHIHTDTHTPPTNTCTLLTNHILNINIYILSFIHTPK